MVLLTICTHFLEMAQFIAHCQHALHEANAILCVGKIEV
jgi:hypothetical protein